MAPAQDVIIIGAGHNALVTACYLAGAGLRPLVLECRPVVGGAAVTEELAPGFRCPTLAHVCGPLHPRLLGDLQLARHGVRLLRSAVRVLALTPEGRCLPLFDDAARAAQELGRHVPGDARQYAELDRLLARLRQVLGDLLLAAPPAFGPGAPKTLRRLLDVGRRLYGLGRPDARRLLRWIPMPVADLVGEWVEDDLLRAILAARGLSGTFLGPRSAGSAAVFLLDAIGSGSAVAPTTMVAGGIGRLTEALAAVATERGAAIRTGVEVARIRVVDGCATGVVTTDGARFDARAVVSGADPIRTLLGLIEPDDLDPDTTRRARQYRCRGTSAKINVALAGRPTVAALAARPDLDPFTALAGRIHIGPGLDYLERAFDAAKYGRLSPAPYLDITIPSLLDPTLAPPERHVMSIHVQFAPFDRTDGTWPDRREELWQTVVRTLSPYVPDLLDLVIHRQILTPWDLEAEYRLTGGHILHGEPALDQLFACRPPLGCPPYQTPIRGLFLCGAGTHPGGGVTGRPGVLASQAILRALRAGR